MRGDGRVRGGTEMEAGRRDSGAVRCASRRTGPRGRSRLDASAEARVVVFAVLLRVPVALDAQVAFRDAEGGMAGREGDRSSAKYAPCASRSSSARDAGTTRDLSFVRTPPPTRTVARALPRLWSAPQRGIYAPARVAATPPQDAAMEALHMFARLSFGVVEAGRPLAKKACGTGAT